MNFRDRYFEALGTLDKKKLEHAHDLAHEIRKFEIELYWKRATYFWAFQLIAFTALGFVLRDGEAKSPPLLLIPESIGVITALAGYLTALGSKFWQENWEMHMDLLEGEMEERLTQVIMCSRCPQFSVSRINQFLLLLLTVGWAGALVFSAIPQAAEVAKWLWSHCHGYAVFVAVVAVCIWMGCSYRTHITGRIYRFRETGWTEYPSKPGGTVPFMIWRDRVGENGARQSESSSRSTE